MSDLTFTAADFALPDSSKLDHCPKCGTLLVNTRAYITTPTGVVRRVVECTTFVNIGEHPHSHYEGTLSL